MFVGGIFFFCKGINIFKVCLVIEVIIEKDLEFLEFFLEYGVDVVGISFVGFVYDVLKVR